MITRTEADEIRKAIRTNDLQMIRTHVALNNGAQRVDDLEARIQTLEEALETVLVMLSERA